ncbi:threonine-phosphate decarboxylase CobD [Alkaliphilus transvaalensis]|uniref:threonine-phosphate decarboxylase CobD n=1 Tax=Alkaliphilus transvaalensis TaxID=114628 RepID=UPI00047A02E3|nr:threonine-phosphate decarboxylase CobD [Alkaliphilus transvaalensis]
MIHGGNVSEIEKEYGISRKEILDFSANINPLGVPETLKKILVNTISDLINYPDINYDDLKNAIGEKYKLSQDHIYVGNGGVQVIFDFIRAVKPKKSLVVHPTFAEYERALQGVESKIEEYQLKEESEFLLNVEDLLQKIDEGYDLVVLCNPNNPTGTLTSKEKLKPLMELCQKKGTFLLIDEAFMDFIEAGEEISLLTDCKDWDHLLITRSFTKFYGIPGLRLGFGVCSHHGVLNQLNKQMIPWTVNTFASNFGKVLLEETSYEDSTYQWLKNEKAYFINELEKLGLFKIYQSSANYIFMKLLNDEIDVKTLREELIKHHILIRDCSNFKGLDNRFLRIAIKDFKANQRMIQALKSVFNC